MKKTIFGILAVLATAFFVSGCASAPAPESQEATPVQEATEEVVPEMAPTTEYERSTVGVEVSMEEFNEDKERILKIIREMDTVMKNHKFQDWLSYIENDSKVYYSQKVNLQKATERLPKKGLQLKSLQDYFLWVFIPSRLGRSVDEIRYETSDSIRAVEVEDNTDVVYYTFHKTNGSWKLVLPPIND